MPRLKGQLKRLPQPQGQVFEFDRCLLYGTDTISRYMGCNPTTLRAWIRKHAFPAGKMPNGALVSSTQLIDNWIVSRNSYLSQFTPQ